ncbi:MAG: hypothetical protein K8S22_07015 [Betaproteobacteria bacterium]|nr:hypothetical protein [Betaproteobacteria bacterium]
MKKRTSKMQPGISAQRGYAMLAIIAVLGVAATTVVVTSLSATAVHNEQNRRTSSALALAKQALIANAASSSTRPGSLPCPDTDNDGLADPAAGACTNLIGRLPWQTLGLPDLRDSSGERLWYALSQQFSDTNAINSTTVGELNITGTLTAANTAAIVFAAGAPVNGQLRNAERLFTPSQYIESYTGPTTFVTSDAGSSYNDQLMVIMATDIFAVVDRRIAKEVQNSLQAYSAATTGRLPWYSTTCTAGVCPTVFPQPTPPALAVVWPETGTGYLPTDDATLNAALPAWFVANQWNSVVSYRVDSNCVAGISPCGAAFSGYSASGSGGALIGFTSGTANSGTKAVLSIAGVNPVTNYQMTALDAAVQ